MSDDTTQKLCVCNLTPCICPDDHNIYEWQWDATNLNSSIVLSENKHDILFHKTFSTGTAAVKGSQPFALNLHYYWEIRILTTLYGTDVMIGVGTDAVDLNLLQNRFCRMLGSDRNSWGYSYRGEVQHDGEFYKYGRSFNMNSVIGCHLDMCKGTLEFYHNREKLGVAFTGLKPHAARLYPIVCSTAAQSAIRLNNAIIIEPTLQFVALRKLQKRDELEDVYLSAPPGLKRILLQQYWWLIEPVPLLKKHPFMGATICSTDDEDTTSYPHEVQARRRRTSPRRKRKRSKKRNRRSRSDSGNVQQSRLMDGPTSVETLRVDRVLRSHTRNARSQSRCGRCSRAMPVPRAGPRTRRQTAAAVCSNCDG